MKKCTITTYQCEVCGKDFSDPGEAAACEARPVTHDRGVSVGDIVRVTTGDGSGQCARVTGLFVISPGWGPSRYDHSRAIVADMVDSWGSRMLTFDSYEVLGEGAS